MNYILLRIDYTGMVFNSHFHIKNAKHSTMVKNITNFFLNVVIIFKIYIIEITKAYQILY